MLDSRCAGGQRGGILSTEIYYFSGTGNSLFVAKKISQLLDAKLFSIVSSLQNINQKNNVNIIGIVFPCYLAQINGIPPIVEEFCNQLRPSSAKYIFTICTYGGFGPFNAYPTLFKLSQTFRNNKIKLSGAFSLKLPLNNLDYDHIPVPINRNHQIMFNYTEKKINNIFLRVRKSKNAKYIFLKNLFCILTNPLFLLMGKYVYNLLKITAHVEENSKLNYKQLIHLTDKSIVINSNCNGCRICEKICPVKNITFENNKPKWNHHCEMCLACDEWCPQKAIHHWSKTYGKDYHHPNIELIDMLNQRKEI